MRTYLLAALPLLALTGTAHGACKDQSRDSTYVQLAVPEGAPRPADAGAFAFIGDGTTLQQVVAKVGPPDASAGVRPGRLIWCLPDGSEVSIASADGTTILNVRHGSKALYKRGRKK
jgi:hypothetical protein